MRTVTLSEPDDFEAWRDAARALVCAKVAPENVVWQVGASTDLFADTDPLPTETGPLSVPRGFVDLARSVVCHSDPERFALLYALLWRVQRQRSVMTDHADPLVRRLGDLAKSVRRDIHKMRAFVRFREIDGHYVAWFEPDHHIVRVNAAFFVRRFGAMRWSILTPEVSIHWDSKILTESAGAQRSDTPDGDPTEDLWKSYYRSTFNPARVKVNAMTKEMPKKYWKNMPETALIPELIASAQARETAMIAQAGGGASAATSIDALRIEAGACTRCSLWQPATQMVFGEGPADAALMFVGEQPGDREDIAGRPFVGPAGQLFDKALAAAGIDRKDAYLTNAVKHFKYQQRGKLRLHAKPGAGEIEACRWWVDQERAIVRPRVTVALGATAARSLFNKTVTVGSMRDTAHTLADGSEVWVTVHPSYILRIADATAAAEEYARFVRELATIRERCAALVASAGV